MVNKWKRLALEKLPQVMQDKHHGKRQDKDIHEAGLHQKIGQMAVQIDFLKKKVITIGIARPVEMIERQNHQLSVRHQCELLGVNRSRLYYKPKAVSNDD